MRYTETTDDSAVSPVIGVILMVAITVILAAVIGTFVLGLGDQVEQNARAGVNADVDANANEVTLSLTTLSNSDYVVLRGMDSFASVDSPDISNTSLSSDNNAVYVSQTGTTVTAYANDDTSGTVTVVAVIGNDPGVSTNGAEFATADLPDDAVQTTVRTVEYDF